MIKIIATLLIQFHLLQTLAWAHPAHLESLTPEHTLAAKSMVPSPLPQSPSEALKLSLRQWFNRSLSMVSSMEPNPISTSPEQATLERVQEQVEKSRFLAKQSGYAEPYDSVFGYLKTLQSPSLRGAVMMNLVNTLKSKNSSAQQRQAPQIALSYLADALLSELQDIDHWPATRAGLSRHGIPLENLKQMSRMGIYQGNASSILPLIQSLQILDGNPQFRALLNRLMDKALYTVVGHAHSLDFKTPGATPWIQYFQNQDIPPRQNTPLPALSLNGAESRLGEQSSDLTTQTRSDSDSELFLKEKALPSIIIHPDYLKWIQMNPAERLLLRIQEWVRGLVSQFLKKQPALDPEMKKFLIELRHPVRAYFMNLQPISWSLPQSWGSPQNLGHFALRFANQLTVVVVLILALPLLALLSPSSNRMMGDSTMFNSMNFTQSPVAEAQEKTQETPSAFLSAKLPVSISHPVRVGENWSRILSDLALNPGNWKSVLSSKENQVLKSDVSGRSTGDLLRGDHSKQDIIHLDGNALLSAFFEVLDRKNPTATDLRIAGNIANHLIQALEENQESPEVIAQYRKLFSEVTAYFGNGLNLSQCVSFESLPRLQEQFTLSRSA